MSDEPNYSIRLTTGQTFFLTASLLVMGFFVFYLGARLGPEIFWGFKVDRLSQQTLLPEEVTDDELRALLKESEMSNLTFHESLGKKGVLSTQVEKIDVDVNGDVFDEGLPDQPPQGPKAEKITEKIVEKKAEKTVEKTPVVKAVEKPIQKPVAVAQKEEPPVPIQPVVKELLEPEAKPVAQEMAPSLFLQVGSFSSKDQAQALISQFAHHGFQARLVSKAIPGKGEWYRVHVGPYSTTEVSAKREEIRSQFGILPSTATP